MDEDDYLKDYLAKMDTYTVSLSLFQVFLGLKEDLVGKLGIKDTEIFYATGYDIEADFKVNKIWVEKGGIEIPQYEFHAEYENIGNDGIHGGISATWTFDNKESSSLKNPPHAEPGAKSEYIYNIPISNFPADKRTI